MRRGAQGDGRLSAADDDGRFKPARPRLAASLACVRPDGTVLIGRRGKPPADRLWSLPGGMVELGETAAEAAVRELMEETGVEAEVVGLVDVVDIIEHGADGTVERHVAVLAFAGRWLKGEGVAGPEALEIAWVRPDEATRYATTRGLAAVLDRAVRIVA